MWPSLASSEERWVILQGLAAQDHCHGEVNDILLNIDKTKELILDFKKLAPLCIIKGTMVEPTDSHTFLGLHILESQLENTAMTVEKAQQRLHQSAEIGLTWTLAFHPSLQRTRWKCPPQCYHSVVCQHQPGWEEVITMAHQSCRGHWLWPSLHGRYIHVAQLAESTEHPETNTIQFLLCFSGWTQPEMLQAGEQKHPQSLPPQELLPSHCQTSGTGHQGGKELPMLQLTSWHS